MELTTDQLTAFENDGFLLLPGFFSAAEVELMRAQLPELFAEASERRVVEKGTNTARAVHGVHATNDVFGRLTRDRRLLEPAMQILGGPVYVHQFKINAKAAFIGDVWEWHQDYIFWLKEDGLPECQLVNISVFLDDVTEFNGPLMLIPGSHREGVIDLVGDQGVPEGYDGAPDWISNLTADLKYSIDRNTLIRLVTAGGIQAPKGPAGSLLLFHPNAVHASVSNLSPFDRSMALVTYNRVDNLPVEGGMKRPDFLAGRDFSPIQPLPAGASLQG